MDSTEFISLCIDLILTIVIYLAVSIVLRFILHKRFNKSDSIGISVGTAILGYLIYIFLYGVLEIDGIPNIPVAFLYGFISYKILHDSQLDNMKKANTETTNETIEEQPVEDTKNEDVKEALVNEGKKTDEVIEKKKSSTKKSVKNGWKIATFVLITIIIIMTVIIFCISINSKMLKAEIEDLNTSVSSLKKKNDTISEKYNKIVLKADFFEKYAVIIPSNTKVYHKYNCPYCDKSSFSILNIEMAKNHGYTPCSHCIE